MLYLKWVKQMHQTAVLRSSAAWIERKPSKARKATQVPFIPTLQRKKNRPESKDGTKQ